MSFYGVFDENVVTFNIVNDILLHPQIAGSMESQGSIETLMDRVASNIGVVHVSNHVEMDGVSAQFKALSDVEELYVGYPGGKGVVSH